MREKRFDNEKKRKELNLHFYKNESKVESFIIHFEKYIQMSFS
jgi:hypothetical protein